jgi:hypothetical protein
MRPNAPISLVIARYSTCERAVQDFTTVWRRRYDGDFHHTSVAVLARDSDGELRVERYNSTAKHLLWGGALLGGALCVLAPATGVGVLAELGPTGAGVIIDHVRHTADPGELAGTADLLDGSTWALVVVVVNRNGAAVAPLLAGADRRSSVDMPWGDLEEELCQDVA